MQALRIPNRSPNPQQIVAALPAYAAKCLDYPGGREKIPLTQLFIDYIKASDELLQLTRPYWFGELLATRSYCERCASRYLIYNLGFCSDCKAPFCIDCEPRYPKGRNGNRRCDCGGEIVGYEP